MALGSILETFLECSKLTRDRTVHPGPLTKPSASSGVHIDCGCLGIYLPLDAFGNRLFGSRRNFLLHRDFGASRYPDFMPKYPIYVWPLDTQERL